jgi:hypothetical protein
MQLTALPPVLKVIGEGAFEGCSADALSGLPIGFDDDGRCGLVFEGGLVKPIRMIKLDPFDVTAGETPSKTYKFDVPGSVRVTGPIMLERVDGASVTVSAQSQTSAGGSQFTITVAGATVQRGTGVLRAKESRRRGSHASTAEADESPIQELGWGRLWHAAVKTWGAAHYFYIDCGSVKLC